jgi:hypothetical protein
MTVTESIRDNQRPSLDQAIEAARAGQRDDAVRMLRQIVADDPQNADAWMWLGGIAPDGHEQRAALERAISIAPHNQRAKRGLEWLRETRPDVFQPAEEIPVTKSTADQPISTAEAPAESKPTTDERAAWEADREAPVDHDDQREQPARSSTVVDENAQPVPAVERASISEDVTQPMPALDHRRQEPAAASSTDRTARMPASPEIRTRPLFAHLDEGETEEMRLPPPAATPAYERATGANIARHLLWIVWSFVLGGVLTATAISVIMIFIRSNSELFQQTLRNVLAQVGMSQVVPDDIAAFGPVIVGVLVAIALVALWLIIGLILRRRWAWVLNLLVAILLTIGAAALFVPFFIQPASVTGGLVFENPAVQTISAVLGVALIFLLVSLASRRAFHRQPAEEAYGWE